MAINLKEVAEKVGVSPSAVSLYFKDPETNRVGKAKKEQIRQVAEQLGYRPNVLARSLVSQKSHTICALIPMDEPYFRSQVVAEILAGAQTILFKKGYSLVFPPSSGQSSPEHIREQLRYSAGYDGFILFGTRKCSLAELQENVEELQRARKPFVVVNMEEMDYDINQVVHKTTVESSPIRYLLSLGHTRILLMSGLPNTPDSVEVLKRYHYFHEQQNLPVDDQLIVYGHYERVDAKMKIHKVLEQNIDFSAVYCIHDGMVLGVYEALSEKGVSIPEDISVIGKGDLYFEKHLSPPLTALRNQRYEEGVKSTELLLKTIESNEAPRKIYLENELILRSSTKMKVGS